MSCYYPSDFYIVTKVCDGCRKHWKDFRVPLDFYNDQNQCTITLEQALEFSFIYLCGQRNEVGLLKACGSRTAICLKRQAELDRRLRENTCKIMDIEEKKLTQLAICELNQLKIESGIEQLKLTKID